MKPLLLSCLALLAGCAGGPMATVNSPNAVKFQSGSDTIFVSNDGGVWSAAFQDYFAKQILVTPSDQLRRKVQLTAAIEAVSKCKVTDSTIDPSALVVNAAVRCP